MITKLNNYEINTPISGYDDLSLFSKLSYNLFASFGIKRKFKGEEFYHVKNNILFGGNLLECLRSWYKWNNL